MSPEEALKLTAELNAKRAENIAAAREQGATWEQVAAWLGVTRDGAIRIARRG